MARILLIDDDASIDFFFRHIMERYFSGQRYRIDYVASPEQARAIARTKNYDIAYVDLFFNRESEPKGLALLKELRAICPKTDLIAISVPGESLLDSLAMRAGAQEILYKGASSTEITESLRRAFARCQDIVTFQRVR